MESNRKVQVNRLPHHIPPTRWPVVVLCLVFLSFGSLVAEAPLSPDPEPSTTVFLVRHAEKAKDDPRDPTLSDAGRRRAEALDALLVRVDVTHLFATEYKRTQQTLEPLAGRGRGRRGHAGESHMAPPRPSPGCAPLIPLQRPKHVVVRVEGEAVGHLRHVADCPGDQPPISAVMCAHLTPCVGVGSY